MSDNLKETQAAFEEWAGYSAEFNPSAWKAWQAAIASQQAAHEAEIAKLKEDIETLSTSHSELFKTHATLAKHHCEVDGSLEEANERIAYLEGLVALLENGNETAATQDQIMADNEKLTALVALQADALTKLISNPSISSIHANGDTTYVAEAISATAETVQAFRDKLNSEAEARGAVKALEEAAKSMRHRRFELPSDAYDELMGMAQELIATSKNAG